jgi:hypothetical protein
MTSYWAAMLAAAPLMPPIEFPTPPRLEHRFLCYDIIRNTSLGYGFAFEQGKAIGNPG